MDGSNVVGATGGILEVIGGAVEVASSVSSSGAVSTGSSSCFGYGGIGGATMEGTLGGVE